MKKVFQNKNNNNFYYIKKLQWNNKASKLNTQYPKLNSINSQNIDPISFQKENFWNNRFVYSKIPPYDSAQDKNVLDPNLLKIPTKNCYYNAIKYNNMINNISSKKIIRGKNPSSYHKTTEKTYLNCSAKNPNNLRIFGQNSSTKDIFRNNTNNNRLLSPELNNINNMHSNNNINTHGNKCNQNNSGKLIKLWNDLGVLEPYRDLFNIILEQLSEERKNDVYEREFNELFELRNNLQILSTNVYYRLKTLEELNNLNDKLGLILKSKQTSSNEVVLKNITKKIENLREYTVNLCLAMRTVKEKINAGHPWGKFDIDIISEKYKFDKNYLIKMKDEMCVLREGYAKYFFNIGDDNTPFLLNASEPNNKNNNNIDPFMHLVPLSNELKENINQCIYIIYQELIGYQNDMVSQNNFRNISPLKKYKYTEKETKNFKTQNEHYNSNKSSMSNNNLWLQSKGISPARTFNPEQIKSENCINEIKSKRILSGGENFGNNEYNKYFNKENTNYNYNYRINENEKKNFNYNNKDIENYEDDNINSNKDMNNNVKEENENNIIENLKEEKYNENIRESKNIIKKYEKIINKKEENKDNFNDDNNKKENKEKNNIDYKNNEEKEIKNIDKDNNEIINKKMIESQKENNNKEESKNNDNENINNNIEIKSENKKENKYTENNTINGMNNTNNDKSNNKNDQNNINSNNIYILNQNNNININNKNNDENNEDNLININIDNKSEANNKNEKNMQLNGSKQNSNSEKDNINISEDKKDKLNNEKKEEESLNISNINKNNISKISKNIEKDTISEYLKSKNLKVKTYTEDINNFSKDFYDTYYQLIPFQIKEMFKTQNNIVPNLLKGISPYLIILYEDFPGIQNNWLNLRNNIFGICTINYELKKNKLKIIINHISTSIEFNKEKNKYYLNDIKHIFDLILKYIKKEFYFDEIIMEYDTNKTNEDLLNIFLNDFNFTMADSDRDENDDEENSDNNKIKEEQENKLVYVNDSMKNSINDIIRQSSKSYLGKNIFTIFNSLLITNNLNYSSSMKLDTNRSFHHNNINNLNNFDDSLININVMNYLLEIKEEKNIKILYNKMSKLDQLIKAFQNNKIKKDEIPLTIAKNIFDILSCAINKKIVDNYFNNTIFFNNYNTNNPSSYLDKDSGIFYNYIKPEKIYVLKNEKYKMKFYQIINNNISLFFCSINTNALNHLNNNNIYIQMNEIYKEAFNENKKEILNDKIIWIPCFEVYNHYSCLSSNGVGTIHEYIKISNKKIKKMNYDQFKINNSNFSQVKIEPDTSRDILFNDDFIIGLINNSGILVDENKSNNNNDNKKNNNDSPYIAFLSYIYKNNFIEKVAK